jgi:DNA-binding NtrC family response regulator
VGFASERAREARTNVSRVFELVKTVGSRLAAGPENVFARTEATRLDADEMILILSDDAVAAALLGALIETLGYSVRFARPPENAEQTIRRVRPKVCMVDCEDPSKCTDELFGRAMMRGISVVIFGTAAALEKVRALATQHDIDMLLVPPDAARVDATIKRALLKAG